jgi:hypothetical protein
MSEAPLTSFVPHIIAMEQSKLRSITARCRKDVRGHRAVVGGWSLQIAEGACFPRDFESKSCQIA